MLGDISGDVPGQYPPPMVSTLIVLVPSLYENTSPSIVPLLSSAYIMKANWSCFSLLWHRAPVAFIVAFDKAGKSKLARMAMMAMTTSSSMSVKPKRFSAQALAVRVLGWSIFISLGVWVCALLYASHLGSRQVCFSAHTPAKLMLSWLTDARIA